MNFTKVKDIINGLSEDIKISIVDDDGIVFWDGTVGEALAGNNRYIDLKEDELWEYSPELYKTDVIDILELDAFYNSISPNDNALTIFADFFSLYK